MEVTFSTEISLLVYILAGIAFLCVLWVCFVYTRMPRRVARAVRTDSAVASLDSGDCIDKSNPEDGADTTAGEPVSVIVRARGDAENLTSLLPAILGQDFKPGLEVIVVNDGSSEEVAAVVDALRLRHSNLYVTFTPDRALNLSSKKLAVTLGVKAAKNRVVVLTTSNAVIDSPHWLSRMARHFRDAGTEVVIGYAAPDGVDDGHGRRTRAYNYVESCVGWLSEALRHRPFRGTEYNLAFTTESFFRNKGFSRTLNLREGVDDIFVNEITTGDNTAVELSRQSMVGCYFYDPAAALHADRVSRNFTRRYLPRRAEMMLNAGPIVMMIAVALLVVASALAWPNLVVSIFSAVLVLAMLTVTMLSWRAAMRALRSRRMLLTLPWMVFTRPFRAILFGMKARMTHTRNYTYSR